MNCFSVSQVLHKQQGLRVTLNINDRLQECSEQLQGRDLLYSPQETPLKLRQARHTTRTSAKVRGASLEVVTTKDPKSYPQDLIFVEQHNSPNISRLGDRIS